MHNPKKIITTLFLLLLFIFSLKAQAPKNQGYIGIGLGPSFLGRLIPNAKAGPGLNINLLNFGYVFGKGFGVSATWGGGAHRFNSEMSISDGQGNISPVPVDFEISYGVLMVGPLYSIKLSDNASLDFKARGGRFYVREKLSYSLSTPTFETIAIGYSFAISFRKSFAPRWCMLISGDYYSGRNQFLLSKNKRLTAISLDAGIGFQL